MAEIKKDNYKTQDLLQAEEILLYTLVPRNPIMQSILRVSSVNNKTGLADYTFYLSFETFTHYLKVLFSGDLKKESSLISSMINGKSFLISWKFKKVFESIKKKGIDPSKINYIRTIDPQYDNYLKQASGKKKYYT